MKFIIPLTPNYVQTDEGQFHVRELSSEELEKYIAQWTNDLRTKCRG